MRLGYWLPVGLLLCATAPLGCEEKGIGRLCSEGVDGGSTDEAIINGAALECPSRVCLRATTSAPSNPGCGSAPCPGTFKYTDLEPLCSATCSSDDDCSDGLTSKTDKRLCHTGFKCAVATTVGQFACNRLCICKDFLVPPVVVPDACKGR
jgi:hypothetical protein